MPPSGLIGAKAGGKDNGFTTITQYFYIIPLKDASSH
jgi:hypothetical protein